MTFIAGDLPALGNVAFGTLSGVKNYVYRLNGIDKYIQFSGDILVPDGGSIELDLMYDSENQSETEYILTSGGNSDTSLFFTSRQIIKEGSSGYISDVFVDGENTNVLNYDNEFHTIKCVISGVLASVFILGARFDYTRNSSGVIKMFRVRDAGGVVINEIPLTNRYQGAMQQPSVGSISATIVNYNINDWEVL